MKPINIAILGASGYTGVELLRLLLSHPNAKIAVLTAERNAGKPIAELFPHLHGHNLPPLVRQDEVEWDAIDIAFCCLPHGTTQDIVLQLPEHVRVIDLSADFRLRDPETYHQWYGHPHRALALQQDAVYGLTEYARDAVKHARLIACPGCYPTATQLPLIPLLEQKQIQLQGIIVDAKSGTTGAGRALKEGSLFCEVNEGLKAYGIGEHRHTPEIEQELSLASGEDITLTFTPHLIPMNRGILATTYVTLQAGVTVADIRKTLEARYQNEAFVHVLPEGVLPSTAQVRGSNQCVMNVFADRVAGRAILVSAIDNLLKGASGQAVQNMNVMCGFEETLGIPSVAVFP